MHRLPDSFENRTTVIPAFAPIRLPERAEPRGEEGKHLRALEEPVQRGRHRLLPEPMERPDLGQLRAYRTAVVRDLVVGPEQPEQRADEQDVVIQLPSGHRRKRWFRQSGHERLRTALQDVGQATSTRSPG